MANPVDIAPNFKLKKNPGQYEIQRIDPVGARQVLQSANGDVLYQFLDAVFIKANTPPPQE